MTKILIVGIGGVGGYFGGLLAHAYHSRQDLSVNSAHVDPLFRDVDPPRWAGSTPCIIR